jgi:hypothetical protein
MRTSHRPVRTIFQALLLATLTSHILSIDASAIDSKAGTSNGAFLKIAADARGVALGPAIVSMAEGTEAMRWNPAALGATETKEASASHALYYQDVAITNLSYAHPLPDSAIGGSLFYLAPGALDGRDVLGNSTGDFEYHDLVASVGYGRRLRSRDEGMEILAGAAVKVVQEKIAETQEQDPAIDLGLLLSPREFLKVGLTARNLSSGSAGFPKELTGGVSFNALRNFYGGLALTHSDDAPMRFSLAGEYRYPEWQGAVVRAGYRSHDDLDDSEDSKIKFLRNGSLAGLTAGAGFNYRLPAWKTLQLQFDYALAPFGVLGISHTVTLKARW